MPEFHKTQTLAFVVQALVTRLKEPIATHSEPLLGNPLYNLVTIYDPRVKGSIASRNSALGPLKHSVIETIGWSQHQF